MSIQASVDFRTELMGTSPELMTRPQAVQLVEWLGGLAPWAAEQAVLEKAAAAYKRTCQPVLAEALVRPQSLPQRRGSCWIAFVQDSEHRLPALCGTFAWPLRWEENRGHSELLPQALRHLADNVIRVLTQVGGVLKEGEQWGLQFGSSQPTGEPDFRNLELGIEAGSGWTSLAAGLIAAMQDGEVNRGVWSSGIWQGGIQEVGCVPEKLQLARQYGCSRFYVPASQLEEAQECVDGEDSGMTIGMLTVDEAQPMRALDKYLEEFNVPPERVKDDPENFHRRCRFHQRHPSGKRAGEFFVSHLLSDLADQQIRQPLQRLWPDWRPQLLVAVVSHGAELIPLLAEALQPEECLLLFTPEFESRTEEIVPELSRRQVTPHPVRFTGLDDVADRMGPELAQRLETYGPERVLLDLTLGNKLMTLAVERAARTGHRLIYLQHEPGPQRQRPETIRPRCAQVSETDSRPPLVLIPDA